MFVRSNNRNNTTIYNKQKDEKINLKNDNGFGSICLNDFLWR